ncbi:hypothetical protein [Campylobacter showae]|uniref:Uncharacterized protein n=1 Tax=Campylobacter showae CC57C TaxID=1073353 RepID=M3IJD5_9BACT|nr:hypothetical protein [Campylobacter showae]EMG30171.1 hypothetical protein H740_07946 [Campylobacter showae CC57C]
MFDRMRDRIAFALICLVFIAICGYIAVKFDGARIHLLILTVVVFVVAIAAHMIHENLKLDKDLKEGDAQDKSRKQLGG